MTKALVRRIGEEIKLNMVLAYHIGAAVVYSQIVIGHWHVNLFVLATIIAGQVILWKVK